MTLIPIILTAALPGCEQIVPADGLPYANHIVIKGMLVAGEPLDSISITHTLPLNAQYSSDLAAIPNAMVLVSVDGKQMPLTYIGAGLFSDPMGDTVMSGKQYTIDVRWNGLHAWASTRVPQPVQVDSARIGATQIVQQIQGFYPNDRPDTVTFKTTELDIGIQSHPNEGYALLYDSTVGFLTDSETDVQWGQSYVGKLSRSVPDSSEVWLQKDFQVYLSTNNGTGDSLYTMTALIGSFDLAYDDFLRSYQTYNNNNDIFGSGGTNPKWNVSGDGIGIFIGMAKKQVSLVFKQ